MPVGVTDRGVSFLSAHARLLIHSIWTVRLSHSSSEFVFLQHNQITRAVQALLLSDAGTIQHKMGGTREKTSLRNTRKHGSEVLQLSQWSVQIMPSGA